MSDSGDPTSPTEIAGSIVGDVVNATGEAIKEAAAITFGKSIKPTAQSAQGSSNGKRSPQEIARYNYAKRVIQDNQTKQYMETKQKEMMRQQQNVQSQTQGSKQVPQFTTKPAGMSNDLAETRSELRAGRKGG